MLITTRVVINSTQSIPLCRNIRALSQETSALVSFLFRALTKPRGSCLDTSSHPFLSSVPAFEWGKPLPKAVTLWCGKVAGSLSLAFISVLCYTKDAQKGLNAQTKTRASTHRVSLTILCVWLLLGVFNFSVKNFIMGVIHHVQTINSFHHSHIFSKTIVLFIKALKNSILVQKVIQCLSTVKYVSSSLTVCSARQWFICEIPREQGQAA